MDNPDPCRDLHRPRDQRLLAGRVLIRNPVLRDPREERARHRAQGCGRLGCGKPCAEASLPSRLMASARFFLTLLLTPDLARRRRPRRSRARADPRGGPIAAVVEVARLITSPRRSSIAVPAQRHSLRLEGHQTVMPRTRGTPPRSAAGTSRWVNFTHSQRA